MVTTGYYYGFWEADPKRWERCRKAAAAGKFDEVMRRRALKLWREKRA